MALKFSRLVPNIQLRGRSSVSFTSRSNPPPQLAKKKLCKCRSECRKLFFLRLRDNCFLHGNRFKTYNCEFFSTPDSPKRWRRICVRCADDKDSYRKNAKMTYYLFCPPFHSESKELTRERTT